MIVSRTIQWLIELKVHKLGHKDLLIEMLLVQDTLRFVKESVIGDIDSSKIDYKHLLFGVGAAINTLRQVEQRVTNIFCKARKSKLERGRIYAGKLEEHKIREDGLEEQSASYYKEIEMTRPLQAILLSPIFPETVGSTGYEDDYEIDDWKSYQSCEDLKIEYVPEIQHQETENTRLGGRSQEIESTPVNPLPKMDANNQGSHESSQSTFSLPYPAPPNATASILGLFTFYATLITLFLWSIRNCIPSVGEKESESTSLLSPMVRRIIDLIRILCPLTIIALSSRRFKESALIVTAMTMVAAVTTWISPNRPKVHETGRNVLEGDITRRGMKAAKV
ncbi:hypothetical protein MMC14_003040 [Varicellaria rhodocarpa]|nr:hypothetical protein [Varicellaria rhodocarpa]